LQTSRQRVSRGLKHHLAVHYVPGAVLVRRRTGITEVDLAVHSEFRVFPPASVTTQRKE
jgi:hypothetical protein